jgi:pimeloyl-ACP methyl ester carboxylesterase
MAQGQPQRTWAPSLNPATNGRSRSSRAKEAGDVVGHLVVPEVGGRVAGAAVAPGVGGQGSPIVLLHGGLATAELSWTETMPALARRFRVLRHQRAADMGKQLLVQRIEHEHA